VIEKRAFTDPIPEATRKGLKGSGIDFIAGTAEFKDATTLVVDGAPVQGKYIVLATGAHPMPLPFRGGRAPDHQQRLSGTRPPATPHRLYRRRVHLLRVCPFCRPPGTGRTGGDPGSALPRPLGPFDADMVEQLMTASRDEGIEIHTGVAITGVEKNGSGFVVRTGSGETFEADLVVHGAGRAPTIEGLNLEAGQVDYGRRGITVDNTMRTSNPKVFAVGDCAATIQLARVADYEAYVAVKNILAEEEGGSGARWIYRAVPSILFTYPEYAMVGATEDALKSRWRPLLQKHRPQSFLADLPADRHDTCRLQSDGG
jgi:glutathione reductase (NADPH)